VTEAATLRTGDTVRFLLSDGFHFGVILEIKPRKQKAVVKYGGKRRQVPLADLTHRPNRSALNG
jgi:hypothetical protein